MYNYTNRLNCETIIDLCIDKPRNYRLNYTPEDNIFFYTNMILMLFSIINTLFVLKVKKFVYDDYKHNRVIQV